MTIETTTKKAISYNSKYLGMTLPKRWCDKVELQKGSILKVIEDGNNLIISRLV